MRTTVSLDQDTAAAVRALRQERGIGLSEAVNMLIRAGLVRPRQAEPFRQRTRAMHARMDVSNIAEVLDLLDGPQAL